MSSIDEIIGKLRATGDIGDALDKAQQEAHDTAQQLHGQARAFRIGAQAVSKLAEHIRKDFDEGKFEEVDDVGARELLLKYNSRAQEILLNLSDKSKSDELVSYGREAMARNALELVGKHHLAAKARHDQLKAPPEPEDPKAKGKTRSGRPSLASRRAAAKKEKAAKKTSKRKASKKTAKKTSKRKASKRRK